jgi:nucleotide-binding universal stress UspA family protein
MKIRRIVCATDFSPCSDQALGYAAFIASLFRAELHMLHGLVLHHDDPHNPEHHFPDLKELEEKMSEITSAGMDRLVASLEAEPSMLLCAQRRGFDASEVILEYVEEVDADLVVMGTHGRRGSARILLGSVADKVVRWADCPILTVPEETSHQTGHSVEQILVPVDFSAVSRRAVEAAWDLSQITEAGLVLLHVVELPSYPGFYDTSFLDDREGMKRKSLEALENLAHELQLEHIACEARLGRPAHEILASCQARECDLIVMGNRGLSGFRMFGLGTTAEHVVRGAKCPILSIRPRESEASSEKS